MKYGSFAHIKPGHSCSMSLITEENMFHNNFSFLSPTSCALSLSKLCIQKLKSPFKFVRSNFADHMIQ